MVYVELDTIVRVAPDVYQCSCPTVQVVSGQDMMVELNQSARVKRRLKVIIDIQIATRARADNWNSGIDRGSKVFADQAFQVQLDRLQVEFVELEAD